MLVFKKKQEYVEGVLFVWCEAAAPVSTNIASIPGGDTQSELGDEHLRTDFGVENMMASVSRRRAMNDNKNR